MSIVIAHRGLSRTHPENSLAAITGAAEHTHVIELDVRCTSDGVLVLHHDAGFRGREGGDLRIGQLDLAELRAQRPGVPTLEEALDLIADLHCAVMLDVKVSRPRAIEAVEQTVAASRITWNDGRQLRRGEPLEPGTATFQSADPQLLQAFRSRTGAGVLELIRGASLPRELIMSSPLITAYAQGVTVPDALASRTMLRALRGLRLGTYVYTINSPARFAELEAAGASGIYTDIADALGD